MNCKRRDMLANRVQVARLNYRTAKLRYQANLITQGELEGTGRLLDRLEAELIAFDTSPERDT